MMLELISLLLVHVKPHVYYCMPLAIPLIMAAAQFAMGAIQKSKADAELKKLGESPKYTVSPELQGAYDRAMEMSEYGFSPQEKASFRNNVAQDINTKTQQMKDIGGGNLGKVIAGLGKIDENNAENKFASSDAQLHRNNIAKADAMAKEIQSQKNRGTGADISDYVRKETAFGNAGKQGNENMMNSLSLAGSAIGGGVGGGAGAAAGGSGARMEMPMQPVTQIPYKNKAGAPDDLNYTDFWSDYSNYNPTVSAGGN